MTDKQQRLLDAATVLAASLICAGIIGLAYYIESILANHNSEVATVVVDSANINANLPYQNSPDLPILPEDSPTESLDNPDDDNDSHAAPAFINLQPTVDQWLSLTNRQVGLVIYDLDNDQIAASYQPNNIFYTASVYKLFFAYDGYRQLTQGTKDGSTHFITTPDKGSLTYSDCLDLMIRESYNSCADPIREDTAAERRVNQLIKQLGLTQTSNYGLDSTANDLTKLLQLYWRHPDLAPEFWRQLADSMLNQPETSYDWRQGLPAGFSNQVYVYNKVGWSYNGSDWDVYNDAAIIEFPDLDRHYIAVVLTRNTANSSILSRLGRGLESTIRANSNKS